MGVICYCCKTYPIITHTELCLPTLSVQWGRHNKQIRASTTESKGAVEVPKRNARSYQEGLGGKGSQNLPSNLSWEEELHNRIMPNMY